jgi:hypothetical protein
LNDVGGNSRKQGSEAARHVLNNAPSGGLEDLGV